MEILVAALGGSFAEVMKRLVNLVSNLGAQYPVAADLAAKLVDELKAEVGDKLTLAQLEASVQETIAILTGKNFGPPNSGAVALQ